MEERRSREEVDARRELVRGNVLGELEGGLWWLGRREHQTTFFRERRRKPPSRRLTSGVIGHGRFCSFAIRPRRDLPSDDDGRSDETLGFFLSL